MPMVTLLLHEDEEDKQGLCPVLVMNIYNRLSMMNEDNDHEVDDDDDTVFFLSTVFPMGTWCHDSICIFTVCSKVGPVSLMSTRVEPRLMSQNI